MKKYALLLAALAFAQPSGGPAAPEPPDKEELLLVSSWYGGFFHGRTAADGSVYDKLGMTVAHRAWRFGTRLILTNPANGMEVVVTVTDRGPYVDKRGLDCSERVAELLGFKEKGLALLRVRFSDEEEEDMK